MDNEIYNVYIYGRKAICPICSGAMAQSGEHGKYLCADCGAVLDIVDFSQREDYMLCKKMEIGGGGNEKQCTD